MTINLGELFRDTARRQPDHFAIVGPGADDRLTYRELDEAIEGAGESLRRAGVQPGSCVGLHVASGRSYIVLNYAIWRCGGRVVPIPVELTDTEKQEICREIALDFLISPEETLAFAAPFRGSRAERAPGLEPGAAHVTVPVRSPREHPPGFHEIDAAFLRFTSGTTGNSKGVVLSHETIFDRIHAANEALRIGRDDRILWLLSMSYHFAVSIVGYLTFGATIVLPPNFLGRTLVESLRRHQGTLIYGSPLHYSLMAGAAGASEAGPASRDLLPSLRLAISTAMALEPETAAAFHGRFGVHVSQALGLIEAGLPCINTDFPERHESVGRVLPAYRLKLDDVGFGSLGEISFAGKGFLDAYYQPWRTRAEIMPDGWFRTGDVGELDADGCLYLRGRSNDVINVMGMKVFPAEVEGVLKSHPRVRDACVFARQHVRSGEAPHASVVPDIGAALSEDELLDHCRTRLAPWKVPLRIEFVEALSRTASGKLLRRDVSRTAVSPAR